jgi:hypothetical protein
MQAVVAVSKLMPLTWTGWASSPMLRCCSRVIVLAVMLVGLPTAQAADTTLTLACQGTTTAGTEDAKPEPISMGIIVNFTKKTVHGFGDPFFGEQLIKITGITETAVYLGSSDKFSQTISQSVMGAIDRVTGDVWADFTSTDTKTGKTITSTSYALKCRPTQRMF